MSFTFLHVADVHLGFRAYDVNGQRFNQREEDIYRGWTDFLNYAMETKPNVILIAGDLFDSNNPQPAAYDYARKLCYLESQVIVIMGNHERPSRQGVSPIEVLDGDNITVCTSPRMVDIDDVTIYCIPDTGEEYDFLPADILLAHGHIDGPEEYRHATGKLTFVADQYVYCALGDLHYHWQKKNICYPGHLSSLTFGTEGRAFGFMEGILDPFAVFPRTVSSRKFVTLDTREEAAWDYPFEQLRDCVARILVDDPDMDTEKIRKAVGEYSLHTKIVRFPVDQERKAITIQGSTLKDEYVDFCKQTEKDHLVEPGLRVIERGK